MKKWYSKYLQVYGKPFSYAPAAVVEEGRGKLAGLQSDACTLSGRLSAI